MCGEGGGSGGDGHTDKMSRLQPAVTARDKAAVEALLPSCLSSVKRENQGGTQSICLYQIAQHPPITWIDGWNKHACGQLDETCA